MLGGIIMAKRTAELEPEFCLYSLYDENTKTFIRKNSWLGFATGPIKIFGDIKKAKTELKFWLKQPGLCVKIVKLNIEKKFEFSEV